MAAPVAFWTPLSTSLKVEFGASMVSNPPSIVTFGATGALFISVAGTGGVICAGIGWTGVCACAFLFKAARFFLSPRSFSALRAFLRRRNLLQRGRHVRVGVRIGLLRPDSA